MIELLQTIAGFFTMAIQSLGNAMGSLPTMLNFSNTVVQYMPDVLASFCSVFVGFALVKFILSLF